uniref:Uncharacterized protein n=1 Tax=Leersia perrieri TaxID=77586 RepID=A0A0D9XZH7_9ORYZ
MVGGLAEFSGIAIIATSFSWVEPPEWLPPTLWRVFSVARVILAVFRLLVFTTILLPLVVLYVFGMCISSAISLWRLTRRGLGNADIGGGDAAGSHLQPALQVLYMLGLVQGVFFLYGLTFISTGRRMVRKVAELYDFDTRATASVFEYAKEIRTGCWKDLSFARRRSLLTHAVDIIESTSVDTVRFLNGLRILDTLINVQKSSNPLVDKKILARQKMLMHQMVVTSASSGRISGKLGDAFSLTEAEFDQATEVRERASRITFYFSYNIQISRISPRSERMLQLAADTPHLEKRVDDMMLQGLVVLRSIAAGKRESCRVISNTEGFLSKIIAPISCDLLHNVDHEAWSPVVVASMELAHQLAVTPGVTGFGVRKEISTNTEAVSAMESILNCSDCHLCDPRLQKVSIKILTQLVIDKNSSLTAERRETIAKSLVRIFTDTSDSDHAVRKSAGEALVMLSARSESNAKIILQADGKVIDVLKPMLLSRGENESRISAAEILRHLCIHHTNDDKEILHSAATRRQTQTGEEADIPGFIPLCTIDIEGEGGNGHKTNWEHMDRKLFVALLSLTATIFEASQAQDLIQLVDAVAPIDAPFTFSAKLINMVERNTVVNGFHNPTVDCLRIMKHTTRMVTSVLTHSGRSYGRRDEDMERVISYLESRSTDMFKLDGVMSLANRDHGAKPPFKTLVSLLKEARELWEEKIRFSSAEGD